MIESAGAESAGAGPATAARGGDTPFLLVDEGRLERNLVAMAAWAADRGVALRPHAKTHKCAQIAQRQLGAGACGLTVATLGEAEAFAAAGFRDLFIAYPLWLSGAKAGRLAALAADCRLRIGVDSAAAALRIAESLPGGPSAFPSITMLVEVDSGHHRSGVAPESAGAVAAAARDAGLRVAGVFTFPGHGYGPGTAREAAARDEARALGAAAESLRRSGIEPAVVSGGSTPTAAFADPGVLTELRPGVYPFNDAQQVELGSCDVGEVALTAVSTVVSTAGSQTTGRRSTGPRIVLDAGSKILGGDRPAWATGFGRILEFPEARIVALSEHHATVELPGGTAVPSLGTVLHVIPNHVCAAVNLVDELVVETCTGAHEHWPVIARGTNS